MTVFNTERLPTPEAVAVIDPNEVKPGEYVVAALFWEEILSKPGEPFDFYRHPRGSKVKLNVSDARRLLLAGAVVSIDDATNEVVIPGRMQSAAPGETPQPLPEQPPVEFDPTKGGGIKETKAYVGDDPVKAAEMLAFEETRDTPRVTLVEYLEGIATEPDEDVEP